MLEDFNPELNNPISEMELATFGNRWLAFIIDRLILIAASVILSFLIGSLIFSMTDNPSESDSIWVYSLMVGTFFFYLGMPLMSLFYNSYFESSEKQATLGKQVMHIKAVTDSGERLSFANALGRSAAKLLSGIICAIGFLITLFRSDGKSLHDLLANTYVVRA